MPTQKTAGEEGGVFNRFYTENPEPAPSAASCVLVQDAGQWIAQLPPNPRLQEGWTGGILSSYSSVRLGCILIQYY